MANNTPDSDYGECYTSKEVMKMLRCKTHSALRRRLEKLKAPLIDVGKPWLIPKAPLLKAMKERSE